MLGDPAGMMHEQLKEPQSFESILSAIASGFHKWGEIARMAGITETSLSHYLRILEELELIERRDPMFAESEGRKGKYHMRITSCSSITVSLCRICRKSSEAIWMSS
jgi:predicted AAA+ superfamily ATPase